MVIADQDVEHALPPSEATSFGPVCWGAAGRCATSLPSSSAPPRADSTVLVTGETGTGKEVVAEAIHRESARKRRSVRGRRLRVDPRQSDRVRAVRSPQGSLHPRDEPTAPAPSLWPMGARSFLDEVGELPVDMQPRLLRVLESQTVKPVGSNTFRKVDVRIVAATNRSLEEMVRAKRFRSDLFFRLRGHSGACCRRCRERLEDVPLLAKHFAAERFDEPGRRLTFTPEVVAGLISHHWPGNVRELRNVDSTGGVAVDRKPGPCPQARPRPAGADRTDRRPTVGLRIVLRSAVSRGPQRGDRRVRVGVHQASGRPNARATSVKRPSRSACTGTWCIASWPAKEKRCP